MKPLCVTLIVERHRALYRDYSTALQALMKWHGPRRETCRTISFTSSSIMRRKSSITSEAVLSYELDLHFLLLSITMLDKKTKIWTVSEGNSWGRMLPWSKKIDWILVIFWTKYYKKIHNYCEKSVVIRFVKRRTKCKLLRWYEFESNPHDKRTSEQKSQASMKFDLLGWLLGCIKLKLIDYEFHRR